MNTSPNETETPNMVMKTFNVVYHEINANYKNDETVLQICQGD